LGGKVKVPTVGGAVMLNVPAGSNTGTSLRLKGRGLLDRKSGQRGDQYVKLKVVLPEVPDDKLKAFLEGWEAGRAYDPRKAMARVPPLIKGYLRLGGFVGDGAVIDHEFNSTDVFIIVKTELVTEKYIRHYERGMRE